LYALSAKQQTIESPSKTISHQPPPPKDYHHHSTTHELTTASNTTTSTSVAAPHNLDLSRRPPTVRRTLSLSLNLSLSNSLSLSQKISQKETGTMTNFTMKRVMAIAAVLVAVTTPSTDAYVARGTRCFRQSKCVEFKVSSCSTNGQREVCIWWQKNRGCDKFWSQPFPDVCTYKRAHRDGNMFKPSQRGPRHLLWRYGLSRMVCQTVDSTSTNSAAYFGLRGYVDCDGYAQKDLSSPQQPDLGTAECQPARNELCEVRGYGRSHFNKYSRQPWGRHLGSRGHSPFRPNLRPAIAKVCQWKVRLPKCYPRSPTLVPTASPTTSLSRSPAERVVIKDSCFETQCNTACSGVPVLANDLTFPATGSIVATRSQCRSKCLVNEDCHFVHFSPNAVGPRGTCLFYANPKTHVVVAGDVCIVKISNATPTGPRCDENVVCSAPTSTSEPTKAPTKAPTQVPSVGPTNTLTESPTYMLFTGTFSEPSEAPTYTPTYTPSARPTVTPSARPTTLRL
jgi:hypothetical protein